jgi:hypothetical protein
MAEFNPSDLGIVTTVIGDFMMTPTKIWRARGETPPATVKVGDTEHPLRDLNVELYSREWWFEYFRKESWRFWQRAPGTDKSHLVKFLNEAFVKPDSLRQDDENKRYLIPKGQFDQVCNDDTLREALTVMLRLGFSSIESGASGLAIIGNEALRKHVTVRDKKHPDTFKLVWRGSERPWESVRLYGSAAAARYDPDAVAWNMREPWHPLSDTPTRNRIHFRNNQNDNCLFTAVSVADDWKCALCYPKIAQHTEMHDIGRSVEAGRTLEQQFRTAPAGRIGKVTYGSGGAARVDYRIVSRTRIALTVLDGLVVDVGGYQDEYSGSRYPEYGTSSIAGTNIFGMKEFVRLFHGTKDDEGFTAFYVPSGARAASVEEVLAAFGDKKVVNDYYPKIVSALAKASLNRVALKWVDTGTATPPQTLDYWQKIEFANGESIYR